MLFGVCEKLEKKSEIPAFLFRLFFVMGAISSFDWNAPVYGVGYVTKFAVNLDYFNKFEVKNVGDKTHNEIWVPAEDLEEFNSNIVGKIAVIRKFKK